MSHSGVGPLHAYLGYSFVRPLLGAFPCWKDLPGLPLYLIQLLRTQGHPLVMLRTSGKVQILRLLIAWCKETSTAPFCEGFFEDQISGSMFLLCTLEVWGLCLVHYQAQQCHRPGMREHQEIQTDLQN